MGFFRYGGVVVYYFVGFLVVKVGVVVCEDE